jgi:hypothetical protein
MEAAPTPGAAVPFPQREHLVQLQARIIESSNLGESCTEKPGQCPICGLHCAAGVGIDRPGLRQGGFTAPNG